MLGETHAPSYRYLMDVAFNGESGTEIVLLYSFLTVKITGRSLQPVVAAILENSCIFIQDFHPNEFLQAPQDAPFIEAIEFDSGK